MTRTTPRNRTWATRMLGPKRRYAFFWLVGTASAIAVSYGGIQRIHVSGPGGPEDAPAVRPISAGPAGSATPATPAPTPRRTPSPRRTRTTASPGAAVLHGVTITSPRALTKVNGRAGVLVRGRVGDVGDAVLRVFVNAPNGLYYLTDGGPVPTGHGRWTSRVRYIGWGPGDIGRLFTVVVVIADPPCQAVLKGRRPDGQGNITFAALPRSCRQAASVALLKTAWD